MRQMGVKSAAMQPILLHIQLQAAVSQLDMTPSAIQVAALWLVSPSHSMQLLGVAAT